MSKASHEFTEQHCEYLYKAEKTIVTKLRWKPENENTLCFQAKVVTSDGRGLDLHGHWQRIGRHSMTRWGFWLTYHGHCVRQFDMARKHKNAGAGWVRGNHKHKYSSSLLPRFAYNPAPPISETDLNQSLIDFLTEANIAVPSNYQYVMFP